MHINIFYILVWIYLIPKYIENIGKKRFNKSVSKYPKCVL